ncbi:hypothetical protein RPE78_02405 [Thioclava litoralis]|uniref:Uncharacterized protein n=1 Tax=Thioclava litoralis TaxID=3076557 RepID=A0ABZ1E266_9RHOB|nr:hypothetical protein RPE78_02405 [Thioclava sp. FTW29]
MPQLVRLYIRNVLFGFALAVAFVATLLAFNVANLWQLVSTSDMGVLAVVMLVVFNTIVFAGVQFAISIMAMAEDKDMPAGGLRQHDMQLQPIPVRVDPPSRLQRQLRR